MTNFVLGARSVLRLCLLIGLTLACLGVGSRQVAAQANVSPASSAPPAETAKPPAAPASAAPSAAAPVIEVVVNPYGLEALWRQGDFVAKGTLIILLIMSVGSWYIAILKYFEQRNLMRQADEAERMFWDANSITDGIHVLGEDSAFRFVAQKGYFAAEHHGGALRSQSGMPQIPLDAWVGMTIQRAMDMIANRLQGGLAFLATVGSTAPFVGLFGTVWGIYHALTAIGIAGQASIDKVAGPVGEALIMTALGLAVAVPAVLAYNWLVRRNKVAMEMVRHFGGGVQMVLIQGGRRRSRKMDKEG